MELVSEIGPAGGGSRSGRCERLSFLSLVSGGSGMDRESGGFCSGRIMREDVSVTFRSGPAGVVGLAD